MHNDIFKQMKFAKETEIPVFIPRRNGLGYTSTYKNTKFNFKKIKIKAEIKNRKVEEVSSEEVKIFRRGKK